MMNTLFEYFIHFCTLRFLINVQIQEDLYDFMTENIFPVATAIYSSVGIILFRAFLLSNYRKRQSICQICCIRNTITLISTICVYLISDSFRVQYRIIN